MFRKSRERRLTGRSKRIAQLALVILAVASSQMLTAVNVVAEPWKRVADWVLVGSTGLGGCTMATRYSRGAFLSLSTVAVGGGEQTWELLVSDNAWSNIREGADYQVDVLMVGSNQGAKRRVMRGFGASSSNRLVTNALFIEFPEASEFSTFISTGMEASSHIAFYLGGQLLGTYALERANTAYRELLKCFEANSRIDA